VKEETGLDMTVIMNILNPFIPNNFDDYAKNFIRCSFDKNECLMFEKLIKETFSSKYNVEAHLTGRIRKEKDRGNHSDVFVIYNDRKSCGIIDGKSSKDPYTLPNSDSLNMETYAQAYKELCRRYNAEGAGLKFICFISGSFSSNTEKEHLSTLSTKIEIPASALTAQELMSINIDNSDIFCKTFEKGGILRSWDFK